jgi:hypothetical protein
MAQVFDHATSRKIGLCNRRAPRAAGTSSSSTTYRHRRLDDDASARQDEVSTNNFVDVKPDAATRSRARRQHLSTYLTSLRPYWLAVAIVFALALLTAGVEMIQPLFMRFIIDRVLLNRALDTAGRLWSLQLAGGAYLALVVVSSLLGSTIHTRRASVAPRALRIPISCVRRATLNATVPYRPTHALSSASTATPNRDSRR